MSPHKINPGPLLFFFFLTGLTQIGGMVYLAARWTSRAIGRRFQFGRMRRCLVSAVGFCVLYVAVSWFVLPPVAQAFGRSALPCSSAAGQTIVPLNRLVCILNRYYAAEPVHDVLAALAKNMNEMHPDTVVAYLDANFALVDGFPLPPHLSHNDGLKVDLAFFYLDQQGSYRPVAAPSPVGYWAFEQPQEGDPAPCANRSDLATLRWDMAFFRPLLAPLSLDELRTATMLQWLATNAAELSVDKVLLEPHLKTRFGLAQDVVRFQGGRAARHDDHVHIAVTRSADISSR